jgi:hypothetical protein
MQDSTIRLLWVQGNDEKSHATSSKRQVSFSFIGTINISRSLWEGKVERISNIFRVIKSRFMGSAGHVARMGERRCARRVLVQKRKRDNLYDTDVDEGIILK